MKMSGVSVYELEDRKAKDEGRGTKRRELIVNSL